MPETATDLERQVAEAKCISCRDMPNAHEAHGTPDEYCSNCCVNCQGTSLRWPGLSRECECIRYLNAREYDALGPYPCSECCGQHGTDCEVCETGSGRVPDVTLEKVLPLLFDTGSPWSLCEIDGDDLIREWYSYIPEPRNATMYEFEYGNPGTKRFIRVLGNTPKQAAIAALLATVTP